MTGLPCSQVCLVRLDASELSAFQVHEAGLVDLLSRKKVP